MMKLITAFELATRSRTELYALLHRVTQIAASEDVSPADRRNALASLENIARALRTRRTLKP